MGKKKIQPTGEVFDLAEIRDDISQLLLGGPNSTPITWGKFPRSRGRRQKTIQLGCIDDDAGVIRIHPALDSYLWPRLLVEFIVYHELLHTIIPSRRVGKRLLHHPPEFIAAEERFPRLAAARGWERHATHLLIEGPTPLWEQGVIGRNWEVPPLKLSNIYNQLYF